MIPENGRFEYLGHTILTSAGTEYSIPLGTTHIVALNDAQTANLTDVYGILGWKTVANGTARYSAIPVGEFFRLPILMVPGISVVFFSTSSTPPATIKQISFYKWSL